MSKYFEQEHFIFLKNLSNQINLKHDEMQNIAYEKLKQANELTKLWGQALLNKGFPQGRFGPFRNSPINQANRFKGYTWAKIYPEIDSPLELAYTVGLDGKIGFITKLDVINNDKLRTQFEEIYYQVEGVQNFIAVLDIDKGLSKSIDELVEWSIKSINDFKLSYQEVSEQLSLSKISINQDITAQDVLDYLKERYPEAQQKTKYIFILENKKGDEIALETRNLDTSTIRLFLKHKPPESILPLERIKFIDRGDLPNGNLQANSIAFKRELEYFQLNPQSLSQIKAICDWYECSSIESPIESYVKEETKLNQSLINHALNRILFGAAGTGKTFHSINHALSIIENKALEDLENEDRNILKQRFDNYKSEGRIQFVTFHQSFSYEDFVEGIRAVTNGKNELSYSVQPGVFKEICDKTIQLDKLNNFQSFIGKEFGRGYRILNITHELIEIEKPNGNILHFSKKILDYLIQKVQEERISIDDIAQKKFLEILGENKLLEPYILNGYNSLWSNLITLLTEKNHIQESEKCVLIIDEINRGNISRIFGELITLIEDSKRQGASEELSVILPYSKKEFSVPSNLYIIGTMNSSDRSLTGLDIALRRRFTFVEMPPRPELIVDNEKKPLSIEGVNVVKLLSVMNQRIEVLLDRDHCIGHANFMSLNKHSTIEDLGQIFQQKIIPQLQEYFFDDWSKINLILFNNGMLVEDQNININALFFNTIDDELSYLEQKKVWKVNPAAFDQVACYKAIFGKTETEYA